MDRLQRSLVACGLGLFLAASGCRSTRQEVPPGRPFANDGRQRKAIEFSSEGHPISAAASTNFMPGNTGGSNLASGIGAGSSRPDPSAFGAPSAAYGGPGTSGLGQPPSLGAPSDPAALPAGMAPPAAASPADLPPSDLPVAPDLNVSPAQIPGIAPSSGAAEPASPK